MQCVQRIGELCIFYFIQQINLKLHVATVNKTKRQYIKKCCQCNVLAPRSRKLTNAACTLHTL